MIFCLFVVFAVHLKAVAFDFSEEEMTVKKDAEFDATQIQINHRRIQKFYNFFFVQYRFTSIETKSLI